MANLRSDVHLMRSLVTFLTASRSDNFTKAAHQLGVSRVAVSRQIADLEASLGRKLFVRNHRTVTLTRNGETLAKAIEPAMEKIGDALQYQRRGASVRRLSVTVTTSFATYWLMPRLMEFSAEYPDIEVNLVVSDRYLDLEAEAIDVAIRYMPENQATEGWSELIQERIFPVFSPRYMPRSAMKKVEDLLEERLLHLSGRYRVEAGWDHWFAAKGISAPRQGSPVLVNTYINMLQGAIEGQGVALAGHPLVDRHLADGTLQRYPDVAPLDRERYYVFARAGQKQAATFARWLRDRMEVESGSA